MSLYAPVVPIQIARLLKRANCLGRYHLLLAHDVNDKPLQYAEVYGDIEGPTVILDNSLIELGRPMTFTEMLPAIKAVKPNYVVLPDILGDAKGTKRLTRQFLIQAQDAEKDELPYFAGVVQGQTYDECMECAWELISLDVSMLCVPRVMVDILGSRVHLVRNLWLRMHLPIHLLGFSNDLRDDIASALQIGVLGIDSAVPIRAAIAGMKMDPFSSSFDPGPRGNYWDTSEDVAEKHLTAIIQHILTYRRCINVS